MKRERYQNGSLTLEKRKDGTAVWVYRWRTVDSTGRTVRPKKTIGTKLKYPTKKAALIAVEGLRADINRNIEREGDGYRTLGEVYAHYELFELGDHSAKRRRTKEVIQGNQIRYVAPRWGAVRLRDISPVEVERWLATFKLAPSSKQKIKYVMSIIFEHAIRYGWAGSNPIRSVRQSGVPTKTFEDFTPAEIVALLNELDDPAYTITLIAATTGLRRGELFGLKWSDVDFDRLQINIVRSVVDQIEGEPKTRASRAPLPIALDVSIALQLWRQKTFYRAEDDWIFASPQARGVRPLWPDAVLKRHLRPAAARAGIQKTFGWHTFRRSLGTILVHSGANVKTVQELLRHASPVITLQLYAKGVDTDKRAAHEGVSGLLAGSKPQR